MRMLSGRSNGMEVAGRRGRLRVFAVATAALALAACASSGDGSSGTGSAGNSGHGGTTGTAGTMAMAGRGGTTAGAGTTGIAGTSGAAGATGAAGRGGTTGAAGMTGAAGTMAMAGTTGTAGTTGAAGRGGVTGAAGATGGAGRGGSAAGTGGNPGGRGGDSGTGGSTGAGGTAGSACPGTLKAGDSNQTITSGGRSRTFIVHVPTGYTGNAQLPVIFDFHPLGGTGSSQKGASGWDKKCDSVGCIAVFPNSFTSDNSWNVGYCCEGAQQTPIDDVQFTRDMIKFLAANACIDSKRVYASGCSNGGGMSYMLACKAADVIAAVAPVDFRCVTGADPASASGLTPTNNTACTCALPRPISVTAFDEGQDNSIVPYNGGVTVVHNADCPPGGTCKANFVFPSAQVNIDTWAHFDMCTGTAMTDPNNSICQTYMSCAANTEVSLCTVPSGSHCGGYGAGKIVDTAWRMFQKESLP